MEHQSSKQMNSELYYSSDKTIHQLFEEQVERWSEKIALVSFESGYMKNEEKKCFSMTYKEVNQQANQVAALLTEKGVSIGDIVGIMMYRSIEMVIGILGILKAGAAYLPIDPDYPRERIQYMLEDSNVKILLGTEETKAKIIVNCELKNLPKAPFHHSSFIDHHPNHLCYIIYTSGSTGTPKGVGVEHRSVVNILNALSEMYPITPSGAYLLKTSFLFDVSVSELFGWFMGGGRLIILEKGGEKDPQTTIDTIHTGGVTHVNFVPAMFSEFTRYLDRQNIMKISGLSYIFLAGEALAPELVNRFRHLNTGIRLENLYGPTEGTVYASGYSLSEWKGAGNIPIGKALSNITLHVLDSDGHELIPGEIGELYIAGAGVARGYLNNPELTAERFIKFRSYRTNKTYVYYKTGDLARLMPDCNIEFLGRADHQVKIRGFRVELGEIENRLLTYKGIKDAVVIAKESSPGDKFLCAYIVPKGVNEKLTVNAAKLQEYLAGQVPEYMVPSFFVFLEQLPLTGSGKVDRKSLPNPEIVSSAEYIAPRDQVEEKLVELWSEVLGIEKHRIGIDDNFFELGGRSLKGAALIMRIHKTFNVRLQLSELFKISTTRNLAAYIKNAAEDRYMRLEKAVVKNYYRLSSSQMRLYVLYRVNPATTAYNIPLIFELENAPERDQLEQAFKKLISRHESLRTSFHMSGEEPVQVIHDTVEFEIEYIAAKNAKGREDIQHSSSLGTPNQFVRPFDLSRAPLLRAAVTEDDNDRHWLMIDIHHIVSDGLSLDILMEELLQLYDSKELLPLEFQYKDYSERQFRDREEETTEIKNQRNFWLKEFSGEIPVLSLPLDFTRPTEQEFEGNTLYFRLENSERVGIDLLAKTGNVTLYMIFLAAFYILLSKLSGQEDIIIGTPLAGRNYVELRQVIGMFVKTLVLRNFPDGIKPFNDFLMEVKERTLAAFENQDYPFEELVETVVIDRDASRNPLFDCMFGLETIEAAEYGTPGLKMKPCRFISHISKFDLTLTVEEGKQDLTLRVEYSTKLFKSETIERFMDYYREILRSIQADPAKRIAEIMIISDEEKRKIVEEFNNTDIDYPRDKTVHQLFEEQAGKIGDRVAVVAPSAEQGLPHALQVLTYRELNRCADHAAAWLIEKSFSTETIMAIMVERSLEMMVGILAILKAGGVYLPIEPREPAERKQYMLADSDAKIIVTTRTLAEKDEAIARWEGEKFFIDEWLHYPGPLTTPNPTSSYHPRAAYIIYTSGSTGIPKGVIVEHYSTVNFLFALFRVYPIYPSGAYLLKTAFIFDVSVSELFGWIMGGSRVIVMEKRGENDPQAMVDAIEKHGVTHINFAPAMFNLFISKLDSRGVKQIAGLTYIFLAGEALPAELVRRFRQFNTSIRLENLYGPTEGTVYASGYSLSQWSGSTDISIGKPLDNVKLYILDNEGRHKAIGEIGELTIAGVGVARGYLNNPELTAERFINKSFAGVQGGLFQKPPLVLYKTGDLSRWLPDGNIEFLGRADHQVKIRGFRVELGDVENQLLEHPKIKEAVVVLREEEKGDKYLCAYIVSEEELSVSGLRDFLSEKLSAFVIPQYFVMMDKLPLTPSGKVNRRQLPAPDRSRPKLDTTYVPPRTELEKIIGNAWKEVLKLENVGIHDRFFDLGGNSLKFIQVNNKLEPYLGKDKEIPVVIMFQYPTIHSLAEYLSGGKTDTGIDEPVREETQESMKSMDIAVIGMAGRFPGAQNINEFWENLKNGVECITFFSKEELVEAGVDVELLEDPQYVRASGFLEGGEYFDSDFFKYSPREAGLMDPQLRIYHECAWAALEDAGYDPGTYKGSIGNYAGAQFNLEWVANISEMAGTPSELFDAHVLNSNYSFSSRISYNLNLRGPSFTIQTACSTSLVAIHLACQGLVNRECDMALAGGVKIATLKKSGYLYQEGMIMSPDGHCRAFDAESNGIVDGNGGGVVVLKRLADALSDNDFIYAVVKGSATNNDGIRKAGYTVPSIEGQAEVIRAAQKRAGIEPESITYVEAHGTGTNLGDPIEIEALKLAFNTGKRKFCGIGSVKTNVGHLDNAAGVTGFIKTVLALYHKEIPPSLHFKTPNPKIDFKNSPFYVNNRLKEWKNEIDPLRAGVSSFGVGGANAHVVLEEWPGTVRGEHEPENRETTPQLLLLSARTQKALDKMSANLVNYLNDNLVNPTHPNNPIYNLENLGYTLQVGRRTSRYRRMLVCSDAGEAVKILNSGTARTLFSKLEERTVVFMFSGQGNQYVNMGLDLYRQEPVFREEMDRCFEILNNRYGLNIKELLYPGEADEAQAETKITQMIYSSPIKFCFEYAMAKLVIAKGIRPDAMIGHSFGEYPMACLAGVFSLEDALGLSIWRSRLMNEVPIGGMLSVSLSEDELLPLLGKDLSLAAVNAPSLCYVSGPLDAIESLETYLKKVGQEYIRLKVPLAAHSPMMDSILEPYRRKVEQVTLNKPKIPYISCLTGKWITNHEAMDPGYWINHLRHTVRFLDGLTELFKEPDALFVQVGPGKGLTMFVEQNPNKKPDNDAVGMVRHHKENIPDTVYLANRIGDMWLYGLKIRWQDYYAGRKKQRIPLPTYPFERRDYSQSGEAMKSGAGAASKTTSLGRKANMDEWFYVPSWIRSDLPLNQTGTPALSHNWLVFMDDLGLGDRLVKHLEQNGMNVITVKKGQTFLKENKKAFEINPKNHGDYYSLMGELINDENAPAKIVHLWCVTGKQYIEQDTSGTSGIPGRSAKILIETIDNDLDNGFYSLFNLARAIGNHSLNSNMEIEVVTDNMLEITGEETINPEKSTALGPVRVIPKEYFNIKCRCTDIMLTGSGTPGRRQEDEPVRQLTREFSSEISDPVIAYRGHFRWVQTVNAVQLKQPEEPLARLKECGVYLITGGLGGIGLSLAGYLARTMKAGLLLIERLPFPPREEWDHWIAGHEKNEKISGLIEKVRELEKLGGNVLVISADVTNMKQMQEAVAKGLKHFGQIHGVIHTAGVVDGRVMQLRTREMIETILAPKVRGTLVLDSVLKSVDLDFFVMCSSLNSLAGTIGQVAYTAANNFLDSYSSSRVINNSRFTISINWDTWQEVGMAVEAAKNFGKGTEYAGYQVAELTHPIFNYCYSNDSRQVIYMSHFKANRSWFLDEHRIMEKATIPGTAYLEMVAAAVENHTGNRRIEINDMYFLTPLVVGDAEEKVVHTLLEKEGEGFQFSVRSRMDQEQDKWQEHVKGSIAFLTTNESEMYDIESMRGEFSCASEETVTQPGDDDSAQAKFVFTGPRWKNISQEQFKLNEGLARLELSEAFIGDLGSYKLHPALLDTATAFLLGKAAGETGNAYVPFSIKKIQVKGDIPRTVFSYARYLAGDHKAVKKQSLGFDITIMDENGHALMDFQQFTFLNASNESIAKSREKVAPTIHLNEKDKGVPGGFPAMPAEHLKGAIRPGEGVEIFKRILASGLESPQVLISTWDLPARLEQNKYILSPYSKETQDEDKSPMIGNPRPELHTPYIPPRNQTEQRLADIWQGFFGIQRIGVEDDFFELGGDSLKALTIISKIRKELNLDVSMTDFFTASNISGLAESIKGAGKSIYTSISPVEEKEHYPLSSAQMRIYLHQMMQHGNLFYNINFAQIVEGPLAPDRLENAFRVLIQRHESLRTSFEVINDEPAQKINKNVEFKMMNRAAEGDIKIGDIVKDFIRPFDLARAPLMRTAVINIGNEKYLWLIDIHHIITDASGYAVMQKELLKLYNDEKLPPLRFQYKDFSEWQNRLIRSGGFKHQEDYWLSIFPNSSEISVLNLPTDFPRPERFQYKGSFYFFELGSDETRKFKELGSQVGATLYASLMTVLNVLLFKYTGQEDVIVGSTTAGRPHSDLLDIVGMFVNMLAIRNFPRPGKTYLELLKEVKNASLNAFENQDVQFEMLVEQLKLEARASRNPLFDVCLNVQTYEQPEFEVKGLKLTHYFYENETAKFDMLLWANPIRDEIHFMLEYSTELFKLCTVEAFSNHFIEIIRQVIENKDIKLGDIRISHRLTAPESHVPQIDFEF
ncbi:MAG: polyketide synthase PksJ [Acidobacteriota bacterium]|nr:polyketide synthase PksJ [Acidobacteriota bacterium]